MDKLTLSISTSLAENKFIKSEDIDVYRYGIEMFIICILEMGALLLLSAIVGNCVETITYFIGFLPIRIYGGGYHADTRLRCFIILLVVYAAFSFLNTHMFLPQLRNTESSGNVKFRGYFISNPSSHCAGIMSGGVSKAFFLGPEGASTGQNKIRWMFCETPSIAPGKSVTLDYQYMHLGRGSAPAIIQWEAVRA